MKLTKRWLWGIGGAAALAITSNLLAPKAAHAVAAALVQVVNTRSAPVPNQDVDQPGRHPFPLYCQNCGINTCLTPAVPANTEFVIQAFMWAGLRRPTCFPSQQQSPECQRNSI